MQFKKIVANLLQAKGCWDLLNLQNICNGAFNQLEATSFTISYFVIFSKGSPSFFYDNRTPSILYFHFPFYSFFINQPHILHVYYVCLLGESQRDSLKNIFIKQTGSLDFQENNQNVQIQRISKHNVKLLNLTIQVACDFFITISKNGLSPVKSTKLYRLL